MNKKYTKCSFEGCNEPHRRNGYCANHSQKFKRGTLFTIKTIKLCSVENCNSKHYCKGFCNKHYRQFKRQELSSKVDNRRGPYEIGNIEFEYKHQEGWSRAIKRQFGDKCMICDWNESNCEAHHIIPKREEGRNIITNAIVLCPNHHKLADIGKLDRVYLQNITDNKIKTLSVELEGAVA